MKRLAVGLSALVTGLAIAPNLALALSAVTTEPANLRAGPAFDFPVVDSIPSDVRVNVHGCLRAYRWCDVSWRDARGWVPGDELSYLYNGRRATIVEYGPRIGLPVVVFSFDTYWDRYYRGRSWYGERERWRTVWRERDKSSARNRIGERPESGKESRTERPLSERTDRTREQGRREAERQQGDKNERRLDRRGSRDERPDVRTGRGDWRDRGETRGYNPQVNPAPHRELNRGMHQGGGNADGRAERSTPDRGREGKSDPNGGGHGQGEHRPD
ncbi:MAG TPA: SH3 domain-containing protein [Xanthobacteraceae bacterium]|jgi:uncharacterized protein YraI